MKGTRPQGNNEIRLVSACFSGTFSVRNRSLFLLGVSTGGRISELLSLTIEDVWQNGKPVTDLLFDSYVTLLIIIAVASIMGDGESKNGSTNYYNSCGYYDFDRNFQWNNLGFEK